MATSVDVTPSVLAWAISESGYSMEIVAQHVGVASEVVGQWERGVGKPTVGQFRSLVQLLKLPSATFFLPKPPSSDGTRLEFRQSPEATRGELLPSERQALRDARRLQLAVATIRADLGDTPPDVPRVRVGSDPERAAHMLRKWLDVGVEEQLACRSPSDGLMLWRRALERRGILVFALSLGSDGIRGFSAWDEMAPQVGFSTTWNAGARTFTLIHELGHLVTRTDSACLDPHALSGAAVERWCDRFAAAVLMPITALRREVRRLVDDEPVTDIDTLAKIAQRFRTSLSATALRLVEAKLAEWSLFESLPDGRDSKSRQGGGGEGRTRVEIRRDQYGHATLEAFVRAVARDALPRSEVIRYLDISDSNLDAIEQLVA